MNLLYQRRYLAVFSFFIVTTVTVIIMEGLTRLVAPQITLSKATQRYLINGKIDFAVPFYETSQTFPFTLTPHFRGQIIDLYFGNQFIVTLNGSGFRTHEFLPKKPDEMRIVVIGDSTTFGTGVNEDAAYPNILEKMLNRKTTGKSIYKVYNLGIGGYGPAEYYLVAKEYLPLLQPDIVVVAFFNGNDLADLIHSDIQVDVSGLPESAKREKYYVDEQHRLHTESTKRLAYSLPIVRESHLGIFLFETVSRLYAFGERGLTRSEVATPPISIESIVQGMEALNKQVKAKSLWLILPSSDDLKSHKDKIFGDAIKSLRDAHVINFFPYFGDVESEIQSYYVDGVHYSKDGAEMIAQILYPVVAELLNSEQ